MATTTAPTKSQHRVLDAPRLQPLLPLIYVAWADGDLTSTEIAEIRAAAAAQTFLDTFSREQLELWLDPSDPPGARELRTLLRHIQSVAEDLETDERRSLADLGLALARRDAENQGTEWIDRRTHDALVRVENALGMAGQEAVRELLPARPDTVPQPVEPAPTFDVKAMTALLDGRYASRKHQIRSMLREPAFRYHYDWSKEEHRAQVTEWLREIARRGIGRLAFPKVFGESRDMGEFVAIFETLAYFDLSLLVKFGVQFGLWGGSIYFLGTEKHHQAYLEKVASMELPGCFAMTEIGHGSNVRDIDTIARYDPETDEFVVDSPCPAAGKTWIGNAARDGRMATVFAQLEVDGECYGVHAVLVPIRDKEGNTLPGVRLEDCGHKMGLNGVDNGRLWFDDVRVPRENLLDQYASVSEDGVYSSPISSESRRFFTMLGALVGGRVSIACASVSAAKSALAIAVHYGARRRQFGPSGELEVPILDYATHQRRLMPRLARTYAYSFALQHLVDWYVHHDEGEQREVEAMAAGLKALASWHATDTIQIARECCGGNGYASVNRFGSLKEDTDIFTTFEGDNIVLLQLVAKSLLTRFRKQFHDNRYFAMIRFVAEQATTALMELNPVVVRRTDEEHLRSEEFLHGALEFRARSQLTSVARRLQKRIANGVDSFEAFLEVQVHLIDAARSHVEAHVLRQFDTAVARCPDPGSYATLDTLRDLYAVDVLVEDLGWFMEAGYIEENKASAIRKLHRKLCAATREQAVHLVDAFDIPDEVLGAPIATGKPWGGYPDEKPTD